MVLVPLPAGERPPSAAMSKARHDPVAAVVADGDRAVGVDQRGVGDEAAGPAAHLGHAARPPVRVPPGPGGGGRRTCRGRAACRSSPRCRPRRRGTTPLRGRSRSPSRRSGRRGSGRRTGSRASGLERGRPSAPGAGWCRRPRRSSSPCGRQPGDRWLGQGAAVDDVRGPRARAPPARRAGGASGGDRGPRPRPGEVLGHQVAVGQDDEPVVGARPGQRGAGADREVGVEPMGMVAEHDVERAVGVDGEAARPGRAPRPGRASGPTGSRVGRIDALDEGDGVVSGRVAQQEELAGVAGDGHGGGRDRAGSTTSRPSPAPSPSGATVHGAPGAGAGLRPRTATGPGQ